MSEGRKRYPVLIAGGGPTGLALAAELGWRGIECLVIEQGDGSVEFPTTNLVNTRTCEHLRRWGIADEVRYRSGFPSDYPRNYIFVTRMNGHEIARFDHPAAADSAARSPYSPEGRIWVSKPFFDPILQKHVRNLPGVEVRYRLAFKSFRQDENGVSVAVVDQESGARGEIEADYLVGCDGGRSNVRRQLGIELQGAFSQGMNVAVLFRSPLLSISRHGPAVQYQIINADIQGAIAAVDARELWRLNIRGVKPDQIDSLDAAGKLRHALGENVPFEITAVRPWTGHCVVAERYRDGRVFLAGDAAHLLWPAGGFGMNTGVGDAVDLGWKLAAVLQGWGGPKLLESYEPERRPIGMRNVQEASEMRAGYDQALNVSPLLDADTEEGRAVREKARAAILKTRAKEFQNDSPGIELGYSYDDSPICVGDGTPVPPFDHGVYIPTTRPGARAPHAALAGGRSTLDLFGRGFVLLALDSDKAEAAPLAAAAKRKRVPFEVVRLDNMNVKRIYGRALVLVRPDGHVVWRGDKISSDAAAIIDRVRGA
ncbi:MAG TPA: FAD-dependent monooxygenase [Candidatus Binatia bacterium]|nr:FAD-dependent monooxygenase [Candidatus Binatia bacterium]